MSEQPVFKIKGTVQHYAWGGFEFIPSLINAGSTPDQPSAEYWLGAHPNSSSLLENGTLLKSWIDQHAITALGNEVCSTFGQLPFLLKILDVREMLSIQVHPSKAVASKKFHEENQKGIPLHAAERNYKDENHKPEQMVALSDFWLLHGFKPKEKLIETLRAVPELNIFTDRFLSEGYQGLFRYVMELPDAQVTEILTPLLQRLTPLYHAGALHKHEAHFWAARAALTYGKEGVIDRGIFSIYFLNLVQLKRGEGIYQPAGMLHAYLEGQNVELMANSDNVLRAGLTSKHIDVQELMENTDWSETIPTIIYKNAQGIYKAPADEFSLAHYNIHGEMAYHAYGPQIMLVMNGELQVLCGNSTLNLARGEAAYMLPGCAVTFQSKSGAEIFIAFVPQKQQQN